MAINDGVFAAHMGNPFIQSLYSTSDYIASNLQWWKSVSPRKKEYKEFNQLSKDILYACVGEAHVKSSGNSKTQDPLLKMYFGQPLMINDNLDVKKCICKWNNV